eukprot:6404507-Amphidinium_carterae.1
MPEQTVQKNTGAIWWLLGKNVVTRVLIGVQVPKRGTSCTKVLSTLATLGKVVHLLDPTSME